MEIANTIDEKLFADYTKRRAKAIKEIIKKGILEGIDWSTLKEPFGISISWKYWSRCPTIRSSSIALSCYNTCAGLINRAYNHHSRDHLASRILCFRSSLCVSQNSVILYGWNVASYFGGRILTSDSGIKRLKNGRGYVTGCLWDHRKSIHWVWRSGIGVE